VQRFAAALEAREGVAGAQCIHELWMRNEPPMNIERMLEQLWRVSPESVPEWLPMRYVEWLPLAYEVAARFTRSSPGPRPSGPPAAVQETRPRFPVEREGRGRTNLYLVLLDYEDSPRGPYGVYVGMTQYAPAVRFDQHKAGIRSAGSVLRRGLELLTGPVLHLQGVKRAQAEEIEEQLAEALRAEGLLVRGGH